MSSRILNYPPPQPEDDLESDPLPAEQSVMPTARIWGEFLTTKEAAAYLRRSKSYLLRQADIPYMHGHPNTYAKRDLDAWFERKKRNPFNV